MVWDDPFYDHVDKNMPDLQKASWEYRGEWDSTSVYEGISQRVYWLSTRALATSIDLFFYYTIVRLALTPWRAKLNQLWYQMTTGPQTSGHLWSEWLQGMMATAIIGVLLGIALWVLTIKLFRQSPGQKILRIYLISAPWGKPVHNKKVIDSASLKASPSVGALFLRALGFLGAALLMGLPYLSILFQPQARAFYEGWSRTLTWSSQFQSAKASWWWQDLRKLPQFFWLKWYQRVGVGLALTLWLGIVYQLLNPWIQSGRSISRTEASEGLGSLAGMSTNTCAFLPSTLEELERDGLRWLATLETPSQIRENKHKDESDSEESENDTECIEQVFAQYVVTEPKEDALLLFLRWWLWSDDPQAQSFIQKDCHQGKLQRDSAMGLFCLWKDLWLLEPKLSQENGISPDSSISPVDAFLRTRYYWFYQQDELAKQWLAKWISVDQEVAKLWNLRLSWPSGWSKSMAAGEDIKFTRLVSDLLPKRDQVEWLIGLCDRALAKGCAHSDLAAQCNWQEDKNLWQASLAWGEEQAYLRFYHTHLCQLKKRPEWWEQAWLKLPRWKKEKLKSVMFASADSARRLKSPRKDPFTRTPAGKSGHQANTSPPSHYLDWWIQHVIQRGEE